VLDKERERHECEGGVGILKLRKAAGFGRLIRRDETSGGPLRSLRGGGGKGVEERLSIACSPGVTRSAENQSHSRASQ
jgi:hypothetical protein